MARTRGDRNDGERLTKLTRANRELRGQLRQLRKQIAHYKRELDFIRDLVDTDAIEWAKARKRKSEGCSSCGSEDIMSIAAGVYTIVICNACGHRKKTTDG